MTAAKKIKRIHPQTGEEVIFESLQEAIEKTVSINNRSFGTHVDKANISLCINGKLNFAAGYKWEKIDESISLEGETWKTHPEYPTVLVSSLGRVKEGDNLRKFIINKMGGNVKIFINNKIQTLWKVIAQTYFILTPLTKCNFKDGNKLNCQVNNLILSEGNNDSFCKVCKKEDENLKNGKCIDCIITTSIPKECSTCKVQFEKELFYLRSDSKKYRKTCKKCFYNKYSKKQEKITKD